jgi:transcription elongation factor GreA
MSDKTTYISADGLQKLKDELQHRLKVVRPEISSRIADAREMGDLSENFAYHDARDQQGVNESRINELEAMLRTAVVVQGEDGASAIRLGSTFTVQTPMGERQFTLVGESEAEPMAGKISNASPLGAAFLGRAKGDVVEVTVPSGAVQYTVLAIH